MLSPEDVTPSRDDIEVIGCFNPGAVEINGRVHLLIRVAERPREKREGFVGLPFMRPGLGIAFDWVPQKNLRKLDNRIVETRADGRIRLTSLSHLRLATSVDGFHIDTLSERPTLTPMDELDIYGVEDARITPLGDEFLITYVGVSPHGIVTKLLATKDFKDIVFPSGAVLRENYLLVYYGAADCYTAVAKFSLNDVLDGIQIQ
jgi:predicted GH43/DUF377 family glycosyl hydrolase